MKNVYSQSVNAYGKFRKERSAYALAGLIARAAQLRLIMAVSLGLILTLSSISLNAQNCPTSGTTVISTNQNTYYPGTQATVSVGATSITLGPIGSGANFGNTPIAVGDIVLVIQMQGAQIRCQLPSPELYGANSSGLGSGMLQPT